MYKTIYDYKTTTLKIYSIVFKCLAFILFAMSIPIFVFEPALSIVSIILILFGILMWLMGNKYKKIAKSKENETLNIPSQNNIIQTARKVSSNPKFNRTEYENELTDAFFIKHHSQLQYAGTEIFKAVQQANNFKDNIDDKIELCNKAIHLFYEHKKFCSQSEGGKLYFADHWEHCHNSRRECFSFIERTEELLKDLQLNYDEYNEYYTKLKTLDKDLLKFLSDNVPILQRDIYKHFKTRLKYDIQKYLRDFQKSGLIIREKSGNSYIIKAVTDKAIAFQSDVT